jgi:hypothetical protein
MPPKRIVTKIGHIYQTIETKRGPRYFQLVAFDHLQLVSDVIVLFRPPTEPLNPKDVDQIAALPVECYTHTIVNFGVKDGLWHKVGKSSVKTDLAQLRFKSYHDAAMGEIETKAVAKSIMPPSPLPFPHWVTWTPQGEGWSYIDDATGKQLAAMGGSVYPPAHVIELIEHGPDPVRQRWPVGSIEAPSVPTV